MVELGVTVLLERSQHTSHCRLHGHVAIAVRFTSAHQNDEPMVRVENDAIGACPCPGNLAVRHRQICRSCFLPITYSDLTLCAPNLVNYEGLPKRIELIRDVPYASIQNVFETICVQPLFLCATQTCNDTPTAHDSIQDAGSRASHVNPSSAMAFLGLMWPTDKSQPLP
jgi:hypothetical protein